MLSDEEKDRIRLEEAYRFEIRQSLSKEEKKGRAWSLLNSPFTLWLLSSVAIGLISWGYQSYTTNLQVRHSNETKRASLASEIGFRLQPME